jgi:hypothetical protein
LEAYPWQGLFKSTVAIDTQSEALRGDDSCMVLFKSTVAIDMQSETLRGDDSCMVLLRL